MVSKVCYRMLTLQVILYPKGNHLDKSIFLPDEPEGQAERLYMAKTNDEASQLDQSRRGDEERQRQAVDETLIPRGLCLIRESPWGLECAWPTQGSCKYAL